MRPRAAWVLVGLGVAFACRVLAQLVQWRADVGFLPGFEQWQSGALPYGVLLASQFVILGLQARIIAAVADGQLLLGRRVRVGVAAFAVVYVAVMAVRLMLGLTVADGHGWFDAPLPSVFHLVLASFLIVWVRYEWRAG